MILRYLGHSSFELRLGDGRKIIFDPYEAGSYDGAVGFDRITEKYDIAVVSHDHPDHASRRVIEDAGSLVDSAGRVDLGGVVIESFSVYHDESSGSERGVNLVSIIEADGLRIAHLGDLGHPISVPDLPALEGVDVILIPVGGYFTIDARAAAAIVREFEPKIAIPMHFKTEKLGFPIAGVDNFTDLMDNVEIAGKCEMEISVSMLSGPRKVVVLDPAL
ncbi:MAG: MBL fold metallo-hydrolase [Candidatus Krumholzibacteriota bacterium]|nr:MBL fold metallo-hydrolase [Candidatus Krumholzibacteriota bacterium]